MAGTFCGGNVSVAAIWSAAPSMSYAAVFGNSWVPIASMLAGTCIAQGEVELLQGFHTQQPSVRNSPLNSCESAFPFWD